VAPLAHAGFTPSLAQRTFNIAPFQVMELVKQAAVLEAQGAPVIHMSIGEPDFTAPPRVLEALERAARGAKTQYTAAVGIAPLRQAIAEYYRDEFGLHVDPSRIIVTAGASAALSLACCALVNPGDEVLLTDPSYPCNRHFIAAFDGVPKAIPVGPETRFQMTEKILESNWSANTRGTLLASPANPTGTSIPFDELERIVQAVRRRGGFTIVDEIYLGLSYPMPDHSGAIDSRPFGRSALALGDDLIITNSFSKFFHMTGWRLGWLVVPLALAPTFEKLTQNLYICASALAQHAALACFEPDSMAIFKARRDIFNQRRQFIVAAMKDLGFEIPVEPDGAFYVYLDCHKICAALGVDGSTALAQKLLTECHVCLVPGADFGANQPQRYLRLSYATELSKMQEAVNRMAAMLKPYASLLASAL
jgi:aspartate/methionine/tyrosine aminotransferase